jgi:hypothetical protein
MMSTRWLGFTVFARGGGLRGSRFARFAAEFMGVEAVHRALALQSLRGFGNDRAFMRLGQREQTPGLPITGEGGFYEFAEVNARTPDDPDRQHPHRLLATVSGGGAGARGARASMVSPPRPSARGELGAPRGDPPTAPGLGGARRIQDDRAGGDEMEGQERTQHGDEVLVGDAGQGSGVEPEVDEGTSTSGTPGSSGGEEVGGALAADDETGAGISSRDADREEAEPG